MREVSLYIHVPFCKRRCPYCSFYHVSHAGGSERVFVAALLEELSDAARHIGAPFVCPTVFFGGGTPSVLSASSMARIFDGIRPLLPRDGEAEITLETNPEDVTDELIKRLGRHGINRLSLGVQSMDAVALRRLGRCTVETNTRAISTVKAHFENFSVDVLAGVPQSTSPTFANTLESVLRYEPPHISLYCLEPGGDLAGEVADFFGNVDPEASANQYLHACRVLGGHGYEHYEVSNFARPGFQSRHNRVYWSGAEYLGIGPGAHSFLGGERFANAPSIDGYVAKRGRLGGGIRMADPRTADGERTERLMLGLRTADGVPVTNLACPPPVIEELARAGLAVLDDSRLRLTDAGYLMLDEIVVRLACAA